MGLKDIKLTIGGKDIDVSRVEQLRLSITKSIADIRDITKSNSSFTKTMIVPGTKSNDIALGFGQEVNSVNAISQNSKPEAILEVSGTTVIKGFARSIKRVIKNKSRTHEYHIQLIGDNGDWKHDINGLSITDLDYSEFDHVYNKSNIDASELIDGSGVPLTKPDIVYPLINYGATGDMPHPVPSEQQKHGVTVGNRFPAIQKRSILKKIFNSVGLKIVSTFVDSDFFRGQYIPFTNKALIHPESYRGPKLIRIGVSDENVFLMDDETTAPNFDTGDNYEEVSFTTQLSPSFTRFEFAYTVPEDSFQNFILEVDFASLGGGGVFGNFMEINIVDPNGFETQFKSSTPIFPGNVPPPSGFKLRVETGMRFFKAGSIVFPIFGQPNMKVRIPDSVFYNEVLLNVLEGHALDMGVNLPDIDQIDFIRAIRDEFNLMILTDTESREVFIEPHDDFYQARAIDWTGKLDKSRDEEIKDLNDQIAKTVKYAYRPDGNDKLVEQVNLHTDIDLASTEIVSDNKFTEGSQTIGDSLFSPTLMDFWAYIGLFSVRVPRLNKEVSEYPGESPQSTKFGFRSLFYDGVKALPSGESWFFDGVERFDFPNFYSVDEINDNDNSLYWSDTTRSRGLFEKFHRNRFEIINKGKLYTAFYDLKDTDISLLDFRVPILVVDTYYLLNKIINYSPLSSGTTQVELIQAVNLDIKAIIDGAGGGILPPLPPVQGPINTQDQNPDQQPAAGGLPPDITTIGVTGGGGVQVNNQGNDSGDDEGTVTYGTGLTTADDGQVIIGTNNEPDDDAIVIIGAGPDVNDQVNVLVIDGDGNLNLPGPPIVLHVNDILVPVFYTTKNGDLQPMYKHKNA